MPEPHSFKEARGSGGVLPAAPPEEGREHEHGGKQPHPELPKLLGDRIKTGLEQSS